MDDRTYENRILGEQHPEILQAYEVGNAYAVPVEKGQDEAGY
jgi:hypothetical protein